MNSQTQVTCREPDPDAIKMFVGQVPRSMDEEDLKRMFSEFGDVYQLNVLRDKMSGQSKGTDTLYWYIHIVYMTVYAIMCFWILTSNTLLNIWQKSATILCRSQ